MTYVKQHALSSNEQIIILARKHPIVLCKSLVVNVVLLVVVAGASLFMLRTEPIMAAPIMSLGTFPLCFFFYSVLWWRNEQYYVTTRRVIRCEGIFNKRVADSSLEKINDVVFSQSWVGRMLDYGNVEIQTASEIGVNILRTIKSPISFKTAMLNQKEALSAEEPHTPPQDGAANGRFYSLITDLERLRKAGVLSDDEFQEKKGQILSRV